ECEAVCRQLARWIEVAVAQIKYLKVEVGVLLRDVFPAPFDHSRIEIEALVRRTRAQILAQRRGHLPAAASDVEHIVVGAQPARMEKEIEHAGGHLAVLTRIGERSNHAAQ